MISQTHGHLLLGQCPKFNQFLILERSLSLLIQDHLEMKMFVAKTGKP